MDEGRNQISLEAEKNLLFTSLAWNRFGLYRFVVVNDLE